MSDCFLIFGPYVGDLVSEMTVFRPYAKWVSAVVKHKKSIVNSHSDRSFMYDDFDMFLPIDQDLTESTTSQSAHMNDLLTKQEYAKLKEDLRRYVCDKHGVKKKDCRNIFLPYMLGSACSISINELLFEPIDAGQSKKSDVVTVIAKDAREAEWLESELCNFVQTKTIIDGEQAINGDPVDAKELIKSISESKFVISSSRSWLLASIVQGVDSFGFGEDLNGLRSPELTTFARSSTMTIDPESAGSRNKITNQFKWFMEGSR